MQSMSLGARICGIGMVALAALAVPAAAQDSQSPDDAFARVEALLANDKPAARKLLAGNCERGHAPSCTRYATSVGAKAMIAAALQREQIWGWERACDLGDGDSCLTLGGRFYPPYMFGFDKDLRSWEQSETFLERACDAHKLQAACNKLSELRAHEANPANRKF